jgi:thiamine-phosphate pyrophosphorylase
MNLPRVQYITHPEEDFSNLTWLEKLADGGISWVQLRIKEEDLGEYHPTLHYKATFIEIADLLRDKTKELGMILTINDHPEVARLSNADGIHLGMEDDVEDSETSGFSIYGGTAHDLVEMKKHPLDKLNYFGVGPFRETITKKKIKSVLGTEGYNCLLEEMKIEGIQKPIFAIGGIEEKDIPEIMKTGVYGIALSGLIHKNNFDSQLIKNIVQKVNDHARSI